MEDKSKTFVKFKSFEDEVSYALDQFDKAKEWADLIKYLQKLNKVIDIDFEQYV
jgi:hypothetical protein